MRCSNCLPHSGMQPASGGNLLNSAVVGRLQWPQDRESQPHNDEIHPCGGDEHYVLAADKKGGCVWTCGPPNTGELCRLDRSDLFASQKLLFGFTSLTLSQLSSLVSTGPPTSTMPTSL